MLWKYVIGHVLYILITSFRVRRTRSWWFVFVASRVTAVRGTRFVVSLSSNSQVTFAISGSTVASSKGSFEKVELIIKGKLFVLFDIFQGENSDTNFIQNGPFSSLAIRITRVIDKSSDISWVSRVDDLIVFYSHQIRASWILVSFDSLSANVRVYAENLSNILHDERVFWDELSSSKSPTFEHGLDGVD